MNGKLMQYLKPRDAKDYYRAGRILVSKRLAYVLTALLLIFGIICLLGSWPVYFAGGGQGYSVFSEDSFPLKFYKGKARILDREGKLLYIGAVKKGAADGEGASYRSDGSLRYRGHFRGGVYEGDGTLYRENGAAEYRGSFHDGKREGMGTLCDERGQPVYEGEFLEDELLYEKLVGTDTKEISGAYEGEQCIYQGASSVCVFLPDIQAVYAAGQRKKSVEDGWKAEGVYVLKKVFAAGGKNISDIEELKEYFGGAVYEGDTILRFEDVTAMSLLEEELSELYTETADVDTAGEYEDARTVTDYPRDLELYVRSYEKDGFLYTFFCSSREGTFGFYLIEEGDEL